MKFEQTHLFSTFSDIGAFVEEYVAPDLPGSNVDEMVIWFCSYMKAQDSIMSMDTKDWAYMMRDGFPPMNTRILCNAWLEEATEDEVFFEGWTMEDLSLFWSVDTK